MAGMSAKASFKIEELLKVEELFKTGEFGSRIRQKKIFLKWGTLKFSARIINCKNQNLKGGKKNILMLAFERLWNLYFCKQRFL